MQKFYQVDFSAFSSEEQLEFMHHLAKNANKEFENSPYKTIWLMHTLLFTRCWNSYRNIESFQPIPAVLPLAIDLLWDYLEGKATLEEVTDFQKSFYASMLFISTGDDSERNETEKNLQFYETYFTNFNLSYHAITDVFCYVFYEIVENTVEWYSVEMLLCGEIGDNLIESFENIYTSPTGAYKAAELEKRERDAYSSNTFCRIMALFQQDLKTALSDESISALREKYKTEYLFSIEDCRKIH